MSLSKGLSGPTQQHGTIYSVQIGRGIAALMVVLAHASLGAAHFYGAMPLGGILLQGRLGVDFFFVLSGFIIFHAHGADDPGVRSLRTYITKRTIRIYPPYWPAGLTMLAVSLFLPQISEAGAAHHPSIMSSLLLLPGGRTALSVAWTLIWEIMFYLTFCLFFVWRAAFRWIMALWACLVLAAIAFIPDAIDDRVWSPLGAHNIEFLAGMAVAGSLRYYPVVRLAVVRWGAGAIGFSMFAAALLQSVVAPLGTLTSHSARLTLYMAIAFALILLCISQIDLTSQSKRMRMPIFLGSASYAIYLVHDPVLSVLNRLIRPLSGHAPAPVLFVSAVLLATLTGCIYHLVVERPLIRTISAKLGVRVARAVASYAPAE